MRIAVALFLLLSLAGEAVATEPTTHHKLVVKLDIPKGLSDSEDRRWCDDETTDAAILSVSDGVHKPVDQKLCTAYGRAAAKAFTDKHGRNYVLLEHGEGAGNKCRHGLSGNLSREFQ